ncbi:putative fungistatic metabolite [Madurella mycetomatis]|uniref:Fungistatic metabolite n=1 Tax=Madurella mycetomatis TaxID=100816 RepID=A0A175VS51_9PEZI|nr:putative fungistatic metabolite [Madurella mycetomatis]
MQHLLALAAVVPAVLAQTFYGCYTEVPTRALSDFSQVDYDNMTVGICETFCTGQGSTLWGLEYGGECYCGDVLAQGSFPAFSTDCAMPCGGDTAEVCGGPNRLSLYGTSAEPPAVTPYPHDPVTETQYEGCWTEVPGVRALEGVSAVSASDMTIDGCANYCLNSGYLWFGLEYTAECYCGNELNTNSTNVDDTECIMPCSGNPDEDCGGPDRLSVYQWV